MNQINVILKCDTNGVQLSDQYGGKVKNAPELVIGSEAELLLDLRKTTENAVELQAVDGGVISNCEQYFFAIDRDFNSATAPLFLKTGGIEALVSSGRTALKVSIPNFASEALSAALGTARSSEFTCEIAGLNENGTACFSLLFPLTVRNRLYAGSNDVPESVASDPAYLTSAEVRAIIAGEAHSEALKTAPVINSGGFWQVGEVDTGISARGPQGEKGEKGEKGDQGIQGKQGERGEAFKIDAAGTLAERSQYDTEAKNFSFLATDTGNVYIKASDTSGDWSDPIPFKGDPGYTPVRGTDYWTEEDIAEIKSYVDEAILNGAW